MNTIKIHSSFNGNSPNPRYYYAQDAKLLYSWLNNEDNLISNFFKNTKILCLSHAVHPNDTTRLDIVIPYEQHFYLKAPSPHERHAWLVALGNAKAGIPPAIPKTKVEKEPKNDGIKQKKSELRLTCDLLMKQVYNVKVAANNPDGPEIEKLDESTNLLSATCDRFIHTLEECLALANTEKTPQLSGDLPIPLINVLKDRKSSTSNSTPSVTRQNSEERKKKRTVSVTGQIAAMPKDSSINITQSTYVNNADGESSNDSR
ncbi:unnamed protein product, partial [Meganyctiphanes norvegica]